MDEDKIRILEERVAWLQRHVAEQDKAMFQMNESLRRLEKLATVLEERVRDAGSGGGAGDASSPASERPPHY